MELVQPEDSLASRRRHRDLFTQVRVVETVLGAWHDPRNGMAQFSWADDHCAARPADRVRRQDPAANSATTIGYLTSHGQHVFDSRLRSAGVASLKLQSM